MGFNNISGRFASALTMLALVSTSVMVMSTVSAEADTGTSTNGSFTLTKTGDTSTVPAGGGTVNYTYTVTNTTGGNLYFDYISDASCSPLEYQSGLQSSSLTDSRWIPAGGTATWTCSSFVTQNTTPQTDVATASFRDADLSGTSETAEAHWPVTVGDGGGGGTPLVCNDIYAVGVQNNQYINQGIYSVVQGTDGTPTYNQTLTATIGDLFNSGSAALALTPDGKYFYYIEYSSGPLYRVDATTGAKTLMVSSNGFTSVKLTAAPDGSIWALDTQSRLWRYMPGGTWTLEATLTANVYYDGTAMTDTVQGTANFGQSSLFNGDIVFDGLGNMWIVGTYNGDNNANGMYYVTADDLAAGGTVAARQVSYIPGVTSTTVMNGIAFGADGTLYASSFNSSINEGYIYTVDPATGERSASPVQTYNNSLNNSFADLASCALPQPRLTATKEVSPSGVVVPGQELTYTITVSNTGNLPTFGSTLNDSTFPANATYVAGSTQLNGAPIPDVGGQSVYKGVSHEIHSPGMETGVIEAGSQAVVTFKVVVGPSGDTVCNQGEVSYVGNQQGVVLTDDPSSPEGGDNTCSMVAKPGINIDKSADQTVITGSGVVNYTYVLTSTGNETVKDISISDDKCSPLVLQSGDENSDGLLQVTETWTYTCSKTLTAGTSTFDEVNVVTVNGSGEDSNTPVDSSDTWTVVVEPEPADIKLAQYVNTIDANTPAEGPVVDGGIVMTYEVSNNGGQPITNPTIIDDNGTPGDPSDDITISGPPASGDTDGDGILDPGEVWIYERPTDSVEGDYAGSSTVTGTTPVGEVSDSDPVHYTGVDPQINIETVADGVENANVVPGQDVTWTYTVTNPGTDPVGNVSVVGVDGQPATYVSGDTDGDGLLDPGEVWVYEQILPAESTPYVGTGTAQGTGPDVIGTDGQPTAGSPVTDADPASTTPVATSIDIQTTVNGVEHATGKAGTTATWQYVVTSPDQQPITDVVVTAVDGTTATYVSGDIDGDGVLDPNESWIFTSTTTTPGDGVLYEGTGSVTGNSYGNVVTDTDPADITGVECPPPTTITQTVTETTTESFTETQSVTTTQTDTVTDTATVTNTQTETVINTQTDTVTLTDTRTNNVVTQTVTDPAATTTSTSTGPVSTDTNGDTQQTIVMTVPAPDPVTETVTDTRDNTIVTQTVTDPAATATSTATLPPSTDANGNTFETIVVTVPESQPVTETVTDTQTDTVTATETVPGPTSTVTQNNDVVTQTVTDPAATATSTVTGPVSTDANGDTQQTVVVTVPAPTPVTVTDTQTNNTITQTVTDPAATATSTSTGEVSTDANGDTSQTIVVTVPESQPVTETVTDTQTDTVTATETVPGPTSTVTQNNDVVTQTVTDPAATATSTVTGPVSTDANGDTQQTVVVTVPAPTPVTVTDTQTNNTITQTVTDPAATATSTATLPPSTDANGNTFETIVVTVPESQPVTETVTDTQTDTVTQNNDVVTQTVTDPAATATSTSTGPVSTDTNGDTQQTVVVTVPEQPVETVTETSTLTETHNNTVVTQTITDPAATATSTSTGEVSTDANGDTSQTITVTVPETQPETVTETAPGGTSTVTETSSVTITETVTDPAVTITPTVTAAPVTEDGGTVTVTGEPVTVVPTVTGEPVTQYPTVTAPITVTNTETSTVTPTVTISVGTATETVTLVETAGTETVTDTATETATVTDTQTDVVTETSIVTAPQVTVTETVDGGTPTVTETQAAVTVTETHRDTVVTQTVTDPAATETSTSTGGVSTGDNGDTTQTVIVAVPSPSATQSAGTDTITRNVVTRTVSDPAATATSTSSSTSTDTEGNITEEYVVTVPLADPAHAGVIPEKMVSHDTVTRVVEKKVPQPVKVVDRAPSGVKGGKYSIDTGGYDAPAERSAAGLLFLLAAATLGGVMFAAKRKKSNG